MSPSRRRRRASPEWEGREILTVAALPGRGLYVRHLGHPEGVDAVYRPTVSLPGVGPRRASFEPEWLHLHLDEVQIVHVHGLSPRVTAGQVAEAADLVRAAGKPLVVTVYHLTDPTGAADKAFGGQLAALLPRADAVITLTDSAREEISRLWGVQALVLAHPHVADFVRMRQARPDRRTGGRAGRFRVGAHLGSLRLPGDPAAAVSALATAVTAVGGIQLEVHVHDHVLDPGSIRYDPVVIKEIEDVVVRAGGVLRAHHPLSDAQLWDHLLGLDASFIPPLYGSHSIWPEACYDLGTRAIMPAGTYAAAQQPAASGSSYTVMPDGSPDAESLQQALSGVHEEDSSPRADPAARWQQRVHLAEAHRRLYGNLLAAKYGRPRRRAPRLAAESEPGTTST